MQDIYPLVRNAAAICLVMLALPALPGPVAAQTMSPTYSVAGAVSMRPEFTRPGGIPGSARAISASREQFMLAPAQPADPSKLRKRKRR